MSPMRAGLSSVAPARAQALMLLERRGGCGARRGNGAGRRPYDGIFKGAEISDARLVWGQGRSQNAVRGNHASSRRAASNCQREHVATLSACGQNAIDEATAAG